MTWIPFKEKKQKLCANIVAVTPVADKKGADNHPRVDLKTIKEEDVKERTGFVSKEALLIFIVIVSNGDMDTMGESNSLLTWFEEWFLYFKHVWGRDTPSWVVLNRIYGIGQTKKVFVRKLRQVKVCCEGWPKYVLYDEDKSLRKENGIFCTMR